MGANLFFGSKKSNFVDVEPCVIKFPGECSVLVFDTSGFTRLTRAHGGIHFSSIALRMQQIGFPILKKFNPLKITREADNLIGAYSNPCDCFKAAICFTQVVHEHNRSLPDSMKHFSILLGGCGVSIGQNLYHYSELDTLMGKAFDEAYEYGENVASKCFLMSYSFWEKVRRADKHLIQSFSYEITTTKEGAPRRAVILPFKDYSAFCTKHFPGLSVARFNDSSNFASALTCFTQRYDPSIDLQKHDAQILKKFQTKNVCVVLFELHHDALNPNYTSDVQIPFLNCIKTLLHTNYKDSGRLLNMKLVVFDNLESAVYFTLEFQEQCRQAGWPISGFGLAKGDILEASGELQIGDCINTASKMGEDIADDGEFLVTPGVC